MFIKLLLDVLMGETGGIYWTHYYSDLILQIYFHESMYSTCLSVVTVFFVNGCGCE